MGFFSRLFGKKPTAQAPAPAVVKPSILGLGVGQSFKVDTLGINLFIDKLVISAVADDHIIHSAGRVDIDGTTALRFYTDDDAWLQILCRGELKPENIIDVKLFHYYDTLSVTSQASWDKILREQVATATYELEGNVYQTVWGDASGGDGKPMHFHETCYDHTDEPSETDQFAMLFERHVQDDEHEFVYVSAEEVETDAGLERSLVISTGINLSSSQLTAG